MVLKAERERVKALLTEAITVLCKNGLGYKYTCAIEGLLGITLDDDDVFLVNINESIQKAERPPPVEESTKQETGTQSPASSSPSGTPRRRRRRSQEGEAGHSPAKRANYGTGEQDHSRTQPQSREDVIVIKEEVSETEFSDFYGDTGGGDNEDSGQYVMQQGDQQYPGAGCSQWDTSQTQGGQSDWPAFNPTQQQQAAISQAATSAMMSPSQVVTDATQPAHSIRNKPTRIILNERIIQPVLQNQWGVAAVRFSLPREADGSYQNQWQGIVRIRAGLDEIVKTIPDTLFILSSITASVDNKKIVAPAIGYWIVTNSREMNIPVLLRTFQGNSYGAHPKLLLQPYQWSEKSFANILSTLLKDNTGGCVPRYVQESLIHCYGPGSEVSESAVQVIMKDMTMQPNLDMLVMDLNGVRFPTRLLS